MRNAECGMAGHAGAEFSIRASRCATLNPPRRRRTGQVSRQIARANPQFVSLAPDPSALLPGLWIEGFLKVFGVPGIHSKMKLLHLLERIERPLVDGDVT